MRSAILTEVPSPLNPRRHTPAGPDSADGRVPTVSSSPDIDLGSKQKVALKMLGGGVPNVGFQLGVCRALKEWGFRFPEGCRQPGTPREYGPGILNPVIGSSSGSFAAVSAVMGYDRDDLLKPGGEIEPITESMIKDRTESNPLALLKRLYTSRQKYTRLKRLVKSEPSVYEHVINTYYPLWKMDALERYLREELLKGCSFESLRARLLILAVTQEQRTTLVLGDESRPSGAGRDYKFQAGVPPWKAAAGSMSLPPYYEPYRLQNPPPEIRPPDGHSVVLIDGETRDPFSTHAAEDSGADLVIVSSYYRVHEYSSDLGHISDYGIMPVMWQQEAQGKDARKHDSIQSRRQRQQALRAFRKHLEDCCEDPDDVEEKMNHMERVLSIREDLDVIEIRAQNLRDPNLTYPYWDAFSLQPDVLDFLYEAGYRVARKQLEQSLGDQHPPDPTS